MSAAREYGLDDDYEWPRPPADGWTADDLDRLPNLPPHTELIDGSLVFVSPQTRFHMRTLRLLEHALLSQAPDEFDVDREFSVKLNRRNRPEPAVLVIRADADAGPRQTWLHPDEVILAVEVVSVDSEERDRKVKPQKYAEAGIPTSGVWRRARGCPWSTSTSSTSPQTRTASPAFTTTG